MTISSANRKAGPFLGNGVVTQFPFTFKVFKDSDVAVTFTDTNGADAELTLNSEYTVSRNADQDNNPGGVVTYPRVGSLIPVLSLNEKLTLTGGLAYTQPTDLPNPGPYFAQVVEDAFDRAEIQIQQVKEITDRSIKISVSDTPLTPLPAQAARANTVIGFDALGNVTVLPIPTSLGAGDRIPFTFTDGVDFTAGVSTQVILPRAPGSPGNLEIFFDPLFQGFDQWSVSDLTVTFASPIPVGVTKIFGYIGTTLATQIPPLQSVTDGKVAYPGTPMDGIKAEKLAFLQAGADAVWRTALSKLQDTTSAKDFGAAMDGVTDDSAAILAYLAVYDNLVIPPGVCRIRTSVTVPSGKTVTMMAGAQFSVDAGITLTIRGYFVSPPKQVFTGSGTVIGIRRVHVAWFGAGAFGDGVTNVQAALQRAHDCSAQGQSSDGTDFHLEMGGGTYMVGSTFTLRPKSNFTLKFSGAGAVFGTTIRAMTEFTGTIAVLVDGQANGVDAIVNYHIRDFTVDVQVGSPCLVGLQVGGISGKTLGGVQQSKFENVYVSGFPICWIIGSNTRLICFERCSGWCDTVANGIALQINSSVAAGFTGDMDFINCQFVGPTTTGKGVSLQSNAAASQLKGIRFTNCIFYKGARFAEIYATGGGIIGDIWFKAGCQWDGFGQDMMWIESNGAGTIVDDVHIDNCYFRGVLNGFRAITAIVSGGVIGSLRNIWVTNNFIANTGLNPIYANGLVGGSFSRNHFEDIDSAGSRAMLFDGCSRLTALENTLTRTGAQLMDYFMTMGAGTDYWNASDNIAGGIVASGVVQDLSGSANKVNTNNI